MGALCTLVTNSWMQVHSQRSVGPYAVNRYAWMELTWLAEHSECHTGRQKNTMQQSDSAPVRSLKAPAYLKPRSRT